MGSKKSAYEFYKNGEWTLLGVSVVTAVNLLLAAFSLQLFFPFSACLPRELILRGSTAGAFLSQLSLFGAIAILFCFLACYIIALRSDRFPAMRLGMVLYAIDTVCYFAFAVPDILADGFRISYVIELVFRWFIIYTLYKADSVFHDPKRKNPNAKPKQPPKKAQPLPPDDDEDDEGIQW